MQDDDWEHHPLGGPPAGAEDIPITGDGDEGFDIDESGSGPQAPAGFPGLEPEERPKPRAGRGPFQARIEPVLINLSPLHLVLAMGWAAAHPQSNDPEDPLFGYESEGVIYAAYIQAVTWRDALEDLGRAEPEYDWGGVAWAAMPQQLRQRLMAQQQGSAQQLLAAQRRVLLESLRATNKKQFSLDDIRVILAQEEDLSDAESGT